MNLGLHAFVESEFHAQMITDRNGHARININMPSWSSKRSYAQAHLKSQPWENALHASA